MAIRDALWACPFCHAVDAIRPAAANELCSGCGATFEPGPRATIVARPAGGQPRTATVEDWEHDLPDLPEAASVPPPPTQAVVRWAAAPRAVYRNGRLLGWAERFGPKTEATVELGPETLRIHIAGEPDRLWPLETVVAVQPSSSSVQLRNRNGELVSFAFPQSSVRLWELWFQNAVRTSYQSAGKGDICEFHPTIRLR